MADKSYEEQWGKGPHVAVDAIVSTFKGEILLIRRKDGKLALPGGFVNPRESLYDATVRKTLEKTGLNLKAVEGEDPESYEGMWNVMDVPDRDERSHIISIVSTWTVEEIDINKLKAGDDAIEVLLVKGVGNMDEKLFFSDHHKIIISYSRDLVHENLGWMVKDD